MVNTKDVPSNPLGREVVIISAVFLALDVAFIAMRFWARKLKRKSLEVCDYLIVAAWLVAFADFVRKIVAARWGVGLHFMQIYETVPENIVPIIQITWSGYFVWGLCVFLIKMSILFLYRSLFRYVEGFIRAVYITMGGCVVVLIILWIGLLTMCHPIAYQWDKTIPGGGCGLSNENAFLVSGSLDLFLDIVLVILPIPIVWRLHNVTYLKKLGICAMFGLGTSICILVGVRFKLVVDTNPADFTHDGEPPGIFSALQLYLGIISACLPLVSPALLSIREKTQSSYIAYLWSRNRRSSPSSSKASNSREASSHGSGREKARASDDGDVPLNSWPGTHTRAEYEDQNSPWGKNQIHMQADYEVRSEEKVREPDVAQIV